MKNKHGKTMARLAISALLLLIDIVSKRWAETALAKQGTMPLLKGVIGFRYAENTGAAFSAFSGATILLSAFSVIVCAFILFYIIRHPEMSGPTGLSFAMVLSGGIGNLIDRMTRGYVVDFFEFQFVRFAIFNVADICITVGACLLFIALLRGGEAHGGMEG